MCIIDAYAIMVQVKVVKTTVAPKVYSYLKLIIAAVAMLSATTVIAIDTDAQRAIYISPEVQLLHSYLFAMNSSKHLLVQAQFQAAQSSTVQYKAIILELDRMQQAIETYLIIAQKGAVE